MQKSKMCSGGIEPWTEHAERCGVVKPFPANGLSFPLEKCPLVPRWDRTWALRILTKSVVPSALPTVPHGNG